MSLLLHIVYQRSGLPPGESLGTQGAHLCHDGNGRVVSTMNTMRIAALPILACALLLAAHTAPAFYNPETGRWLNRDPIVEKGGKTLYGFCLNNPGNSSDMYGLLSISFVSGGLRPCGGWNVFWRIDPGPLDGPAWIVSRVTVSENYSKCPGKPVRQEETWFEARQIGPNQAIFDQDQELGVERAFGTRRADARTALIPYRQPFTSDIIAWGHQVPAAGDTMFSTFQEPIWWPEESYDSATRSTWSQWTCCCDRWWTGDHSP